MRYSAKLRFTTTILATLMLALLTLPACKSKEKTPSVVLTPQGKAVDISAELSKGDTLLKVIPTNSYGFFTFSSAHDAYQRFSKSPWGSGKNFSYANISEKQIPEQLASILKTAGVTSPDAKTANNPFAELVVFGAPPSEPNQLTGIGMAFRSTKEANLLEKLQAVKQEISKSGAETTDHKVSRGNCFSFDFKKINSVSPSSEPQATEPLTIFVGWTGDIGVFASTLSLAEQVLASPGTDVPQIMNSPIFKRATLEFPSVEARFAFGYFEIANLIKGIKGNLAQQGAIPDINPEQIPFQAVSASMAMGEAPQNIMKLMYKPGDASQQKWFEALGSSQADQILSILPTDPLLFLSLDGQTLHRFKELAMQSATAAPQAIQGQLAVLDSLTRIGLFARMAPVGQSILPIPDLTIVMQSSKAEESQKLISDIVSTYAQNAGMPAMAWQDKDIEGTAVKSMMSPLGFGVFLTRFNDFIIASSTEGQMRLVLQGIKGNGQVLAKNLPPKVIQALANESTVGNIYLNFGAVGSFMETMGSTLSMFAPQNNQAQEFIKPENIAQIKKMGLMVGSVTLEKEAIAIKSFYQKVADEKA